MSTRIPSIYEIDTDMNYHSLGGMQPAERNVLEPESIVYARSKPYQETRYVSSHEPITYFRPQQHQEVRYVDKTKPPTRTFCGCCSKRCCIGLFIGLGIGLLVAAAVAIPLGVVTRYATLGTISSTPNWIGTYQMDNSCDSTTCCCFTNQIVLSQTSTGLIQVAGTATGRCNGMASAVALTQTMPTGFQLLLSWAGEVIRLQLGQSSSYISIVNINYPYCSASTLKISYSPSSMENKNFILMMFLIFLSFGLII